MKNIISVTEEIDRIWNECIQVAVEDGIINPWNFMHPYRNNYEMLMTRNSKFSIYIMKETSGREIFRVVSWYEENSVEVQGVLTYRGQYLIFGEEHGNKGKDTFRCMA